MVNQAGQVGSPAIYEPRQFPVPSEVRLPTQAQPESLNQEEATQQSVASMPAEQESLSLNPAAAHSSAAVEVHFQDSARPAASVAQPDGSNVQPPQTESEQTSFDNAVSFPLLSASGLAGTQASHASADFSRLPHISAQSLYEVANKNIARVSGGENFMTREHLTSALKDPKFSYQEKLVFARILDHIAEIDAMGTGASPVPHPRGSVTMNSLRELATRARTHPQDPTVRTVQDKFTHSPKLIQAFDSAYRTQVGANVRAWGNIENPAKLYSKIGGLNLFDFKEQWVQGYRDTIQKAANQNNLPPLLLAGTVFNEVGGAPETMVDDVIMAVRDVTGVIPPQLKGWLPETLLRPSDQTSVGNVSIQVEVAAQTLGYDPKHLTPDQRQTIIDALRSPRANIFISAMHLRELANVDFPGVKAQAMTDQHVRVIGARYNVGGSVSLNTVLEHMKKGTPGFTYGVDILQHRERILRALRG